MLATLGLIYKRTFNNRLRFASGFATFSGCSFDTHRFQHPI